MNMKIPATCWSLWISRLGCITWAFKEGKGWNWMNDEVWTTKEWRWNDKLKRKRETAERSKHTRSSDTYVSNVRVKVEVERERGKNCSKNGKFTPTRVHFRLNRMSIISKQGTSHVPEISQLWTCTFLLLFHWKVCLLLIELKWVEVERSLFGSWLNYESVVKQLAGQLGEVNES